MQPSRDPQALPESVYSTLIDRIKHRPGIRRNAVRVLHLLHKIGAMPASEVQEIAQISVRTLERVEYDLLDVGALHVFTDLDPETRKRRKMYALQVPAELAVAS